MLIAVRNFFRDAAAEQSLYDELLAVRLQSASSAE
jgi:hypothetical protein